MSEKHWRTDLHDRLKAMDLAVFSARKYKRTVEFYRKKYPEGKPPKKEGLMPELEHNRVQRLVDDDREGFFKILDYLDRVETEISGETSS